MAQQIVWTDAAPKKKKDAKERATSGASFATVEGRKLTVYRVKKDGRREVWHAAVNGKRISKAFNNAAEAKAEAANAK